MRIPSLFLFCTLGFAGAASAAENFVDPGAYYDRGASGTGLLIDEGPHEKAFGAWFGFTPAGESMYLTFGGQFAVPTGGGSPVLESQLFASRGGQCLGCPYQPPVTTAAPQTIRIVALTPRHLHVTIAGQTWLMEGMEIDVATSDLPAGTWDMRLEDVFTTLGSPPIVVDSLVNINPIAPLSLALRQGIGDGNLPPAGAKYFEMQCVARCAEFEEWRVHAGEGFSTDPGRRVIVWYDNASRRSGLELVESDGSVVVSRRAFTLSVGEYHITGKDRRFTLAIGNFVQPLPEDNRRKRLAMTRRLLLPPLSIP